MSVCKGSVGSSTKPAATGSHDGGGGAKKNSSSMLSGERGGKENASSGHKLRMFSDPSPTKAKGGGSKTGGSGGGDCKEDGKGDATAFDLMPPPLPRTPGKVKGKGGPSRSSVLSPLGRHDPNLRQSSSSSGEGGDGSGSGTMARGRTIEKVGWIFMNCTHLMLVRFSLWFSIGEEGIVDVSYGGGSKHRRLPPRVLGQPS